MSGGGDAHEAVIAIWMMQADSSSPEQLVDRFETGLHRILERAQPTLGAVTLGAIVDRVLYTACERFPFLGSLESTSTGIDFEDLRKALHALSTEALAGAARFALVELLTVLGHLTAEILTPALHAELSTEANTHGQPKARARETNE